MMKTIYSPRFASFTFALALVTPYAMIANAESHQQHFKFGLASGFSRNEHLQGTQWHCQAKGGPPCKAWAKTKSAAFYAGGFACVNLRLSSLTYNVPWDAPFYHATAVVHVETIALKPYDRSCKGEIQVNGKVVWSGTAIETDWDAKEEGTEFRFYMSAGDKVEFRSEGKKCVVMMHKFDYRPADYRPLE